MKKKQIMLKALEEIANFKRLPSPSETFGCMKTIARKAIDATNMGKNAESPIKEPEPVTYMGKMAQARLGRHKKGIIVALIPAGEAINTDQAKLWFPVLFETRPMFIVSRTIGKAPHARFVMLCDHDTEEGKKVFALYSCHHVVLV